jgi:general secretion pathway protein A
MYNDYFALAESPFENRSDPRFLYLGQDHKETLAALLYLFAQEKGFGLLCGDVGTGKTMMINSLLDKLPNHIIPVVISNPRVIYSDILRYLAKKFGINHTQRNILEVVDDVKQALVEARDNRKIHALIVDEAHLLSDSSLEDIRLLSNLETPERKLLQILLAGQYELSRNLDRPELRQLRQQINISRFLSPLDADETLSYIDHRLKKAGADFDRCFEADCRSLIYSLSQGVPRQINHLCDNALLIAMTEGLRQVNRDALIKAGEALRADQTFTPKPLPSAVFPSRRRLAASLLSNRAGLAAGGVGLLFLLVIALSGHHGLSGGGVQKDLSLPLPASAPVQSTPPPGSNDLNKAVPPAQEVNKDLAAPEVLRNEIEAVLFNIRKAHDEKDISQFMSCYSRTFPRRAKKRRETMRAWKRFDYSEMIFSLGNLQETGPISCTAGIIWNFQVRDRRTNKTKISNQTYRAGFIKERGQWRIGSLKLMDDRIVKTYTVSRGE